MENSSSHKSWIIICDQTILLDGRHSSTACPEKLRRVRYYDADTQNNLVFLTSDFTLPALGIAKLYRCRWQVELFFKWIRQHLRIKASLYAILQILSVTPFEKPP